MSLADTQPRTESRSWPRVVRRLSWGVIDQFVSSLSNFALGLYLARTLGATVFGAFTLAFVTYTVILNASRGISTDPLLVRYSGATGLRWREAVAASSGLALLTGLGSGALCVIAGLLMSGSLATAFIAIGVGLPGLMLQDSWRFAFFAAGRGLAAVANDVVWTVLLCLAIVLVHFWAGKTLLDCVLAFGGTATIAALVGVAQAKVLPRPGRASAWLREHRHLSVRYLIENVSASGAGQVRSFVIGGVVGLAAVGYVRAAEIMMGPFLVILMGVCQVAVPEASRVFHQRPTRLIYFCLTLGGVQALVALLWGVALLIVFPIGLGNLLLANLWPPVHQLLPPVILNVAAVCLMTSATSGLRAMGVAKRSLRAQLITSVSYVGLGSLGAVFGGAPGTCWGVMAANSLGAVATWYQLRSALAAEPVLNPVPLQGVEPT